MTQNQIASLSLKLLGIYSIIEAIPLLRELSQVFAWRGSKIEMETGSIHRGGIRSIYYWFVSQDIILLLYAYPKSEQDDLTPEQLKQLKKIVEKEYI